MSAVRILRHVPHHSELDVVFHAGSRVIAVESKCTEYLSGKRRKAAVGYLSALCEYHGVGAWTTTVARWHG